METLSRPFVVFYPSAPDPLFYHWLSWAPRILLDPLAVKNMNERKINLRDILLENTTSNIILGVRMGYTVMDQTSQQQTLMVFKYDKMNNIMFW